MLLFIMFEELISFGARVIPKIEKSLMAVAKTVINIFIMRLWSGGCVHVYEILSMQIYSEIINCFP